MQIYIKMKGRKFKKEEVMTIKLSETAPDFSLKDQNESVVSLKDLNGHKILLSFHPLAWTSVCAKQMNLIEENYQKFIDLNTIPFGISVDPVPSKKAWAESLNLKNLKILSDFWPHGEVSSKYGLFMKRFGFSERANIIIDEKGTIIFAKVYPIKEVPDFEEVLVFLRGR